eukprot:GILK01012102.1.p1 GENE.GILK01012102.1~~GILK01012102.1.p1  ORF type:complete len:201 (+),score=6.56 GILK01012102.1:101-703(+)
MMLAVDCVILLSLVSSVYGSSELLLLPGVCHIGMGGGSAWTNGGADGNPNTPPGQNFLGSTSPLTVSTGSSTLTLTGGGGGSKTFNGNPTTGGISSGTVFSGASSPLSAQPTVRRCLDGATEFNLSVASNCINNAPRVCVNGQFVCPGTISALSGTATLGKSSGLTLTGSGGKTLAISPPPTLAADAAAAGLLANPPNGA